MFDGDERPLGISGDPRVPEVRQQIKDGNLYDPLLRSGLHTADVKGGSGFAGPEGVQHIGGGTMETHPSCEELPEGSVSPHVNINIIQQCRAELHLQYS